VPEVEAYLAAVIAAFADPSSRTSPTGVGVLGLILWFVVWAPRAQGRRTTYRQTTAMDGYPTASRTEETSSRDEFRYDNDYPR
jgi:hypothetical protein